MANQRARQLRKTMTSQEVKFWLHLRTWRDRGFHFRRQAPRDGYILDFVCLKARIIIEIDGSQHTFLNRAKRDAIRDQHFEIRGFRILRFWNIDVNENFESVLEMIDHELSN